VTEISIFQKAMPMRRNRSEVRF